MKYQYRVSNRFGSFVESIHFDGTFYGLSKALTVTEYPGSKIERRVVDGTLGAAWEPSVKSFDGQYFDINGDHIYVVNNCVCDSDTAYAYLAENGFVRMDKWVLFPHWAKNTWNEVNDGVVSL
jgi:hypothetical protein